MKKLESCSDVKAKAWELLEGFAEAGYRVRIWSDGYAEVHKADGAGYTVENFRCDCPDAQRRDGGSYILPDGRRVCKHVLVTSLGRPCEHCYKTMVLRDNGYFECSNCGNARDVRIVAQERRAAQERTAAAA